LSLSRLISCLSVSSWRRLGGRVVASGAVQWGGVPEVAAEGVLHEELDLRQRILDWEQHAHPQFFCESWFPSHLISSSP
jgi:hypothetical protein